MRAKTASRCKLCCPSRHKIAHKKSIGELIIFRANILAWIVRIYLQLVVILSGLPLNFQMEHLDECQREAHRVFV